MPLRAEAIVRDAIGGKSRTCSSQEYNSAPTSPFNHTPDCYTSHENQEIRSLFWSSDFSAFPVDFHCTSECTRHIVYNIIRKHPSTLYSPAYCVSKRSFSRSSRSPSEVDAYLHHVAKYWSFPPDCRLLIPMQMGVAIQKLVTTSFFRLI